MNKKEQLEKRLQALSKLILEEDRLEAALAMACSYETIKRYLNGGVKKISFAQKLVAFLEERISVTA